ncbi:Pre-mRNA-splicing factor CWC26 [Cytospora mali]|uniref:Pre-mRNA-splicing factor CWC26 n=1 Tax=Cytospora mali TaxID=578113 RepID=A0A194VWM8_CYTMA|nr:Pre-mRNA-splicing factor CWC26 [Valsa mali]
MPSDLSSYLATHYLATDSKPASKKRKRKHDKTAGGGLLIQDDDDEGWGKSSRSKTRGGGEGDDDMTPVTVGKVKEFRKTTKANWKTLGGSSTKEDKDAAAAADAILASAAAESAAARGQEDEDPTVVEEGAARMADGTHAGLQSAAAVTAQIERRQKEEREQFEAERRAGLVKHGEEETHYRDATGRRVDVGMKRAEARRALQEAEEKERAKKEALKGEVQIEEARRRKELLEDAKTMKLARTADDEEMNDELKGQRRWNDPMANFLGEEDRAGGDVRKGSSGGGKTGKKSSRRPVYKGAAPPNRYGIRPGYRWDGVDRSNGFEAERFKAVNRRERNKGLEYSWQMDE